MLTKEKPMLNTKQGRLQNWLDSLSDEQLKTACLSITGDVLEDVRGELRRRKMNKA
jgi:hypothetical protein